MAVDRAVEQVAVVADDEDGVRIGAQVALEPHRAFEVEVVGRLVEQQDLRLEEQHGGERNAHAPAARQRAARALLRCLVEAEAGEDLRGARRRGVRVDVGEPLVDLGDAMRVASRARPRRAALARSVSAASTQSMMLSSPPGASCAT